MTSERVHKWHTYLISQQQELGNLSRIEVAPEFLDRLLHCLHLEQNAVLGLHHTVDEPEHKVKLVKSVN